MKNNKKILLGVILSITFLVGVFDILSIKLEAKNEVVQLAKEKEALEERLAVLESDLKQYETLARIKQDLARRGF